MASLGDSTTYGNHVITGDLSVSGKGSLPIGATYLQLPSQSAPDDIFTGTWSNISSSYAGDFFRAEGGRAASFGSSQGDTFQGHIHRLWMYHGSGNANSRELSSYRGITGGYVGDRNYYTSARDGTRGMKYYSQDAYGAGTPRHGDETRPVNQTIRVWKRIS